MEARSVERLPREKGWQFEPKWDGFRCLAFRSGRNVELRSKSGKSLSRYFTEVLALLEALPNGDFVLDGELVVPVGSTLSFDALQQRLHPAATRVRRLAHETPATFVLFDCLMTSGSLNLLAAPLSERRTALEKVMKLFGSHTQLRLSPYTRDRKIAQRWLDSAGGALDGVIEKDSNAGNLPGERAMLKIKRLRTADCVVGGFRYGADSREVGSLLLGLYDAQAKLDHVGYTSSIARADRGRLTKNPESSSAHPVSRVNRRARPADGATSARLPGSRCATFWWLRCVTTT